MDMLFLGKRLDAEKHEKQGLDAKNMKIVLSIDTLIEIGIDSSL